MYLLISKKKKREVYFVFVRSTLFNKIKNVISIKFNLCLKYLLCQIRALVLFKLSRPF